MIKLILVDERISYQFPVVLIAKAVNYVSQNGYRLAIDIPFNIGIQEEIRQANPRDLDLNGFHEQPVVVRCQLV